MHFWTLIGAVFATEIAALALLGGHPAAPPPPYQVRATQVCLVTTYPRLRISRSTLDYIAERATGGGLYVGNEAGGAVLAFASDDAEVKRLLAQYRLFVRLGAPPPERHRNAVVEWDAPPTWEQKRAVEGCLR